VKRDDKCDSGRRLKSGTAERSGESSFNAPPIGKESSMLNHFASALGCAPTTAFSRWRERARGVYYALARSASRLQRHV